MCTNKSIQLKGRGEDAANLMMTVAEVIELHGPIKMIMLSGWMRGARTDLTGSTMLESIRINEAEAVATAKKEDDSRGNFSATKNKMEVCAISSFSNLLIVT